VDKRYRVSGLFVLEVNAKDMRDALETAKRILANSGIEGYVIEVEEVRS
jgi:phosphoribosylformylglycinamidine (FGAM) synthase PurS component